MLKLIKRDCLARLQNKVNKHILSLAEISVEIWTWMMPKNHYSNKAFAIKKFIPYKKITMYIERKLFRFSSAGIPMTPYRKKSPTIMQ